MNLSGQLKVHAMRADNEVMDAVTKEVLPSVAASTFRPSKEELAARRRAKAIKAAQAVMAKERR